MWTTKQLKNTKLIGCAGQSGGVHGLEPNPYPSLFRTGQISPTCTLSTCTIHVGQPKLTCITLKLWVYQGNLTRPVLICKKLSPSKTRDKNITQKLDIFVVFL